MRNLIAAIPIVALLIIGIAIANWIRVFNGEFAGGQIWLAILPTAFIVLPLIYGLIVGIKNKDYIHKQKIIPIPQGGIDNMTGEQFEMFCKELLKASGWTDVKTTPASNDYGADLVATSPAGERFAIQCKRFSSSVPNGSVQQAYTAMAKYYCTRAAVMTNNFFTKNAVELANSNRVMLIDRDGLNQLAKEAMEQQAS